uniref:Fibrinogen C-terminal domain-containing protein n=1 Tax=Anopheles christyi TaxID=43041 RepID=A0A182K8P5_9DIPT
MELVDEMLNLVQHISQESDQRIIEAINTLHREHFVPFQQKVEQHLQTLSMQLETITNCTVSVESGLQRNQSEPKGNAHPLPFKPDMLLGRNDSIRCTDGLRSLDSDWLLLQHRFNGSIDFYRNWTEYRNGFGDSAGGEFWIGLERMYKQLESSRHELLIMVEVFTRVLQYAHYDNFSIEDESKGYAIKSTGRYMGTAGDLLSQLRGMQFSTHDRANDMFSVNCAKLSRGAWWFRQCYPRGWFLLQHKWTVHKPRELHDRRNALELLSYQKLSSETYTNVDSAVCCSKTVANVLKLSRTRNAR